MIFKSQFFKNTSILTLGILIAQIFNFAVYPILGRIYNPEDFALLATVTSICSILSVVGTAKYEMSIILCKSEKEAINACFLCLTLSSVLFAIVALLFLLIGKKISMLLNESRLYPFLFVSLGTSLAIIIFNCYNEWCIRQQQFKGLAINKINNSSAVAIAKLGFGFHKKFSNGLVWGDFFGRWISAIGCIVRFFKTQSDVLNNIEKKEILYIIKRFKKFPQYILPGQIVNSLSIASPVFLISYYYNTEITGYYSMALTLLLLPISVISNAIKDVFRQKVVVEINSGRSCRKLLQRITFPLSIGCIVVASIVYPFLPNIFSLFVGDKWLVSGEFCQILLIMAVFEFVAMSLNGVLLAAEKLKIIFIWQLMFFVFTIVPIIVGGLIGESIYITLWLFSISRSIGYAIYIYFTFKFLPV